LIEEIWNKGNLALIDELFATDYVFHSPTGVDSHGLKEYKQRVSSVRIAFPDIYFTIDDVIAKGDKVVHRWSASATHKGEFGGIKPTGKKVSISAIGIDRIADGKFVESWERYDTLGMMHQLGVISK
jgi:steroid delta-isomerase-like uncharacterized protein